MPSQSAVPTARDNSQNWLFTCDFDRKYMTTVVFRAGDLVGELIPPLNQVVLVYRHLPAQTLTAVHPLILLCCVDMLTGSE